MTTTFPNRLALTAVLTTVGALAIPAMAGATVTPVVDGSTLTVTSDDAADTITLAAAGGFITVNGAATTLPANDNAEIAVDAGAGNDTVDATALAAASYKELVINGGDGDDLLTGGADNDHLDGDAGDDRLVGFRGGDQALGDIGNDTMVWNNGDGTDVNDGEAGNDEVEVNGAPTAGDALTVRPGDVLGRVQFNRTNLNPFGIDFTAERLTVNGLGGGEVFAPAPAGLAGLTSLTVNGGTGADELAGADGADLINGGDGADTVIGGAGDDRLVGDRGSDIHVGGEGDDVLVWNNGDGSDSLSGDDGFDRAEVNGSATAGDVFTLAPDGTGAKFERTNLVPFTLDLLADTEAVEVNGGGGNDQLTVAPGLARMPVAADGGTGDDQLTGGEEEDSFLGGSGSDTITPGPGSDLADGGADNDALLTRDQVGDLVRGGAGTDSAETDSVDVDVVSGVEDLDASAPDDAALLPELGEIEVVGQQRNLVARVPLLCPAAETGGCDTTVRLETAKAVRLDGVRAVVVLGSASIDLDPGQQATLRVPLARGAGELAKGGELAARVRLTSSDDEGNLAQESVRVGLRIPRG